MTDRKDFKRVVRARARRTGESYSSALRNVRNARPDRSAATASEGSDQREPFVNITRTIPDVRSTNIDKTVRFYTELFGFATRTEDGRVVSFVSASHDGVEVTLNSDGSLPPGFTVEVETEAQVAELFDRQDLNAQPQRVTNRTPGPAPAVGRSCDKSSSRPAQPRACR